MSINAINNSAVKKYCKERGAIFGKHAMIELTALVEKIVKNAVEEALKRESKVHKIRAEDIRTAERTAELSLSDYLHQRKIFALNRE